MINKPTKANIKPIKGKEEGTTPRPTMIKPIILITIVNNKM